MKRRMVYTVITLVALAALLTAGAGLAVAEPPAPTPATNVGVVQALVYVDGVLTDGLNVSLFSLNDDGSRNPVGTMASGGERIWLCLGGPPSCRPVLEVTRMAG